MVQFGMKTELNQTELFAKFFFKKKNWTELFAFRIELFWTEPNYFKPNIIVIIGTIEKI